MGGDDLGSDDEYFLAPSTGANKTVGDESPSDGEDVKDNDVATSSERKRKTVVSDGEEHGNGTSPSSSGKKKKSKKSKKSLSPEASFIEQARRGLEKQSARDQASFLSSCLRHYSLLEKNTAIDKETLLEPHNFTTSSKETLVDRLIQNGGVSMKQLKGKTNNNKHAKARAAAGNTSSSPTVIIVCQSARRAVAILKDLSSPLKNTRVAKLFPKNGSVESQLALLRGSSTASSSSIGLAVGTPHRLQELCRVTPLFSSTRLVVLDCFKSPKGFTVCTLPDTASHVMSLLRDHVLPEIERKERPLRLAFF